LLDKTQHARQRVFNRSGAIFVNIAAHADRVRHVTPKGRAGFFEFADQKCFFSAMRKQHVDRLQMGAGHRENVGRALFQIRGERLAALIANVDSLGFANLDRVKTGRLAADRMDACGSDLDIVAITDEVAKKSFRDRTTADIAGANKEDVFHGGATALAAAERT